MTKKRSQKYRSTVAIDANLAADLRDMAKANNVGIYELTNAMLAHAMAQGGVTVEVQRVVISPKVN